MSTALDITEREWQAQVVQLAKTVGWRGIYHTFDSRKSASGFPDLFLTRERIVLVELKTSARASKLSPTQKAWITALLDAGAEVYVARPADLDDLARVLAHRGDPLLTGHGASVQSARRLKDATRAEATA